MERSATWPPSLAAETWYDRSSIKMRVREKLLARQLKRFLSALLYHSLRKRGVPRSILGWDLSQRVEELFSHVRILDMAKAAISQRIDNDLAQLGAALVVMEIQARSDPLKRIKSAFNRKERQAWTDLQALSRIFAAEIGALRSCPLDRLAQALQDNPARQVSNEHAAR